MEIEQAVKHMENDEAVMYHGEKWYILFINRLNMTCELSDQPFNYREKVNTKPNISIEDLMQWSDYE